MLDQNTDRMWYVIGAVIIGAALIFIMNGTMPELFASVGETFESKTDDVMDVVDELSIVDGVGPMQSAKVESIGFNMKNIEMWQTKEYTWLSDTVISVRPNPTNYQGGIKIPVSYFDDGELYTIKFDITKLSGEVQGLGGHVLMSGAVDVYIDGVAPKLWDKGYNTIGLNRWSSTVVYPNDNEKHSVEVTFRKISNDAALDENVYIQPNRAGNGSTGSYLGNALDYEVLIDNLEIYRHL